MTPVQDFEQRRRMELAKTEFSHQFSSRFKAYFKKALHKTSMFNIGIGLEIYERLVGFETSKPVIAEVLLMCKIIEGTNPEEMGQSLDSYMKMMIECKVVRLQCRMIDDEISKVIQQKMNLDLKAGGLQIGAKVFDLPVNPDR